MDFIFKLSDYFNLSVIFYQLKSYVFFAKYYVVADDKKTTTCIIFCIFVAECNKCILFSYIEC